MLFGPNINTRFFLSIPLIWISLGGWVLFILSSILFSTTIFQYKKNTQASIFLSSALVLGVLGIIFYQKEALVNVVLVFTLGIGLIVFALDNPFFFKFENRDSLLLLTLLANGICGFGFLFLSNYFLPTSVDGQYSNFALFLSSLFFGTIALGFIQFKNNRFSNGHFIKIIAIPWLVWTVYIAIDIKDLTFLILPACLSVSLLTTGFIPWDLFRLPPNNKPGHLLFYGLFTLSVSILLLFSNLTNGILVSLAGSVQYEIQIINTLLLAFNLLLAASFFIIGSTNIAINELMDSASQLDNTNERLNTQKTQSNYWANSIRKTIIPFLKIQEDATRRLRSQAEELSMLSADLNTGRRRLTQLALLNALEQELKPILDPPVVAQLTANTIHKSLDLALVTIFTYDYPRREFVLMASAGKYTGYIPPEYRQSMKKGIIGRAARLKKFQYSPDTRLDPDFFSINEKKFLSEAVIPLLNQGLLKGVLVLDSEQTNAFSLTDLETFESIGTLLLSSWNRSNYDDRLKELIRAGINLTTTLETDVVIQEIAAMVQQTLAARFVVIAMMDQLRVFNRTASAGFAPKLMNYLCLDLNTNIIIQTVLNASRVHRLHDIMKLDSKIILDNSNLHGFLGFPIKMRGQRIGAILAFGKQGGAYFSEEDESLATLISNQAAASIEMTWLYQQLSTAFNTTTRLYDLSNAILRTEKLNDAAAAVAEAAYRFGYAKIAGIVLFNPQKEIEAQVQIDANGLQPGQQHPTALIKQALINNRVISEIKDQLATACLPLATPHRQYGVLWLTVPEAIWVNQRYSDDLHTLANQAALALERGILLVETQQQREQIQSAYKELEITYDQTLISLSSAVDARDKETEGHCIRVSKLTYRLGKQLGLPTEQLKSLERGALLHDIGKIGISDNILLKPGPLDKDEWDAMRQHPDIGARMIEGIPFLQDTIPVIRYHQERWNGCGYPLGLKGEEIPLQARVFAVADVFDALTSTRPYRQRVTIKEAVKHIRQAAGEDFDPKIVDALEELARSGDLNQYLSP